MDVKFAPARPMADTAPTAPTTAPVKIFVGVVFSHEFWELIILKYLSLRSVEQNGQKFGVQKLRKHGQ